MIAQLGHHVFGKLSDLGVPSFAFVNGLALGGGLEIALNSTYRTVDASAAAIALPEVFLGIIPGWGGAYLLPNLIGIENALEVVISNPLKQNRMLKPQQAFDYGIVDAIFPAANYLEDSLTWADGVLGGTIEGRPQERAGQDRAPHQVADRDQDGARHAREPHRHGAEVAVRRARAARQGEERHEGGGLRPRGRGARRARRRATSSRHPCMPSISCRSARSAPSARPTRRSRRRSRRSASSAPGSWRASSRCCSCASSRCRC